MYAMNTPSHLLPTVDDPDCARCFIAERELELVEEEIEALNTAFNERCARFTASERISRVAELEIDEYRVKFDELWKKGNDWIAELYKCELQRKAAGLL